MLKEIKDVLGFMVSLMCVLSAIAVIFSDIYNIELIKLLVAATILSLVLGSIPFIHTIQAGKK